MNQRISFSEAKLPLKVKVDCGLNLMKDKEEEELEELEKLAEENLSEDLTPDYRGFFTLSISFDAKDAELSSKLEEDIAWYEPPVSVLPILDPTAGSVLEVKMKTKDLASAAFLALKDKYPGLQLSKGNKV